MRIVSTPSGLGTMPGLGNRPSSLSFPTPGRGSFRAIAVTINTGSQESRDAGGSTRMTQSCAVGATVRATPTSSVATRPDAAGYRSLQTRVRHEPKYMVSSCKLMRTRRENIGRPGHRHEALDNRREER